MNAQSIDHAALAPAYVVVGAAVLVLLADLTRPGMRTGLLGLTGLGPVGGIVAALWVGTGRRGTFCTRGGELPGGVRVGPSCSYVVDQASVALTVTFCLLVLVVIGLSAGLVAAAGVPPGEYGFLLLCSLAGAVVLASARDLLTLIIALETLTLPVYILVGLRGSSSPRSAEAAVTFFVVSVVSTAVTLMGVGLLYGLTGAIHLDRLAASLAARPDLRSLPLTAAAVVLVLAGLLFKLAAVPFHAWAPGTYDGAPIPVAAYLATASKLGGVVAVLLVVGEAFRPVLSVAGPVLAAVAVASMTVGNLVALRQRRLMRLLAWSSVAQAGYLLAPLGVFATSAGRDPSSVRAAVAGTVAFTLLYLLVNIGTFASVVAHRGPYDGGTLDDLRGAARATPWAAAAFVLGMAGLAGLPPGLAGLFAKVAVIRAVLDGSAGWLAVIVGINAVIGLAYYLRAAVTCFLSPRVAQRRGGREAGTASTEGEVPSVAESGLDPDVPAAGVSAASSEALAVDRDVPGGGTDVPAGAVPGAGAAREPGRASAGGVAIATLAPVTSTDRSAGAEITVGVTLAVVSAAVVVVGFWPQWVFEAAKAAADALALTVRI